ncbi:MAG: hypothetical protein IPL59_08640 [Candidatus Competibacteraceae bacterium]|nr:hypothetical protein [Candidatus Competibacteraceae bacterium]
MPTALIAQYLNRVLEVEGIPHEELAVQNIARAGDGSMRDALGLLDPRRFFRRWASGTGRRG